MWRELFTDLLIPMGFGSIATVAVYESVRFYRKPLRIVITPKPRWVVRRTPTPPPAGTIGLPIPADRRKSA